MIKVLIKIIILGILIGLVCGGIIFIISDFTHASFWMPAIVFLGVGIASGLAADTWKRHRGKTS